MIEEVVEKLVGRGAVSLSS